LKFEEDKNKMTDRGKYELLNATYESLIREKAYLDLTKNGTDHIYEVKLAEELLPLIPLKKER
jgi:hypothetical protein